MRPLLIERLSKKQKSLCALPRRFSSQAAATSPVATYVLTHNPWSWSGTPPLKFKDGGRLETPWGAGSWGVLDETHLFADFVGSRHNLEFEPSRMSKFTSARCGDGDPVVGVLAEGGLSRDGAPPPATGDAIDGSTSHAIIIIIISTNSASRWMAVRTP
jgi:hypothetical protein